MAPRSLWPLLTLSLAPFAACTALSGFDELSKSGCPTADCSEGGVDASMDAALDVAETDAPADVADVATDIGAETPDGHALNDARDGDVGDAAGLPCPTGKGPAMVRATTTTPGGLFFTFCVDTTEVTNAHYQAFLDATPPLTLQPAICASVNDSFVPAGKWPLDPAAPNHPVVSVDWCDAAAYCAWAGKRLCGRLGGGPNPQTEQSNPFSSEWMNACAGGSATQSYPYGSTYDAGKCNGAAAALVDVTTKPECTGGTPGLFDMSGNAYEWEDSCGSLTTDNCFLRGGSFQSTDPAVLGCAGRATRPRNGTSPNTGIRCCAD